MEEVRDEESHISAYSRNGLGVLLILELVDFSVVVSSSVSSRRHSLHTSNSVKITISRNNFAGS